MWLRGMFLITFALFIDFIQAALGWTALMVGLGLQSITPIGGGAVGAAAGAAACYTSAGTVIQGVTNAFKCGMAGGVFGALASTFGVPFGTALGFALEIVISLTLGTAFIVTLILFRMYYTLPTTSGFLGELVPGLDILPGWTLMAVWCVLRKQAEEGEAGLVTVVAKIATIAAAVSSPTTITRSARTIVPSVASDIRSVGNKTPLDLKYIVPKAANDTRPYVQKAA